MHPREEKNATKNTFYMKAQKENSFSCVSNVARLY